MRLRACMGWKTPFLARQHFLHGNGHKVLDQLLHRAGGILLLDHPPGHRPRVVLNKRPGNAVSRLAVKRDVCATGCVCVCVLGVCVCVCVRLCGCVCVFGVRACTIREQATLSQKQGANQLVTTGQPFACLGLGPHLCARNDGPVADLDVHVKLAHLHHRPGGCRTRAKKEKRECERGGGKEALLKVGMCSGRVEHKRV